MPPDALRAEALPRGHDQPGDPAVASGPVATSGGLGAALASLSLLGRRVVAAPWCALELNAPPPGPREGETRSSFHLLAVSLAPQSRRLRALGGEGRGVTEDGATEVGAATFLPAGTVLRQRYADPNRFLNIVFDPARLGAFLADARALDGRGGADTGVPPPFAFRQDRQLRHIAEAAADAIEALGPAGEGAGTSLAAGPAALLYLESLATAALARLALAATDRVAEMPPADGSPAGGALEPPVLAAVLAHIEASLAEERLSLADLAAVAGMGPVRFHRAFRAATGGLPPHRYVLPRRVERAKLLLARDGATMTEAALAAGFSSQSHMTDHFRRHVGEAPGRWRLRHARERSQGG